jgi:hypothetical protein
MTQAMTTSAEYRQYAEECLQAMRGASLPEVRPVLLAMVKRWNELADHAERNSHLQSSGQILNKSST